MTRLAAGEAIAPPEASGSSKAEAPAPSTERPRGTAQDEAVFKDAYIPRTLDEVYDPERDVAILQKPGGAQELIYAGITGMEGVQEGEQKQAAAAVESSDESDGSESDGESGEEEDGRPKVLRGHRHEDRDAKKVSAPCRGPSCTT
jgi:RIO kinase 1